jgi:two-component system chemotaxis sensor kinase CheA
VDEIVKEFLIESYENLDCLNRDLVALEKDPHAKETLASIFRTIHTLKGGSGFLGFGKLEAVAHVGENLLSKLRDGVITINPELASALLATVDAVRFMLGQIEITGQPGDRDFSSLIELLARLNDAKALKRDHSVASPQRHRCRGTDFADQTRVVTAAASNSLPTRKVGHATAETTARPAETVIMLSAWHANVILAAESAPTVTKREPKFHSLGRTIRVDVGLLDKLMNLVGELVLARNQVLSSPPSVDGAFLGDSAAPESHYDRTAGKRYENPDAAYRKCMGQIAARGA